MADRVQSYKVICGGGLNSNENHLDLSENSPGVATRLVNYEVSLFGGYRRIEGFAPYNPNANHQEIDPANSEGKVLSVAIFKDDNLDSTIVIASRKVKKFTYTATASQTAFTGADTNSRTLAVNNSANTIVKQTTGTTTTTLVSGTHYSLNGTTVTLATGATVGDTIEIDTNEYKFYRYVAYAAWAPYTTGVVHKFKDGVREVKKLRHVSFNFGGGNKICFVDGVNNAILYDGSNWKSISPDNSGGNSSPGGPSALARPELVDAFENHLFLAGDRVAQATIAYSAPLDPLTFTSAAGAGQLAIGFDVVQFKPFRDDLFVFGTNGIKKVSPDVTAGFVLDQITTNVGCIARDSVLEIGGDLVFLAPDGLRPVAGTSRIGDVELETISKSIQQLLTALPSDYDLETLNGVVIRSKSQLRYFIGDDSVFPQDSFGIVGGLRSADQRLGWEFGELVGIRASCCDSAYVNSSELVLHGDYNGKVYQQEKTNQFDGADILAVYATPFFDYGDTEVKKTMRKANTFIRAEGPLTMNMAVTYDWEDPNTAKPSSYSQESAGAPVRYKGKNINYVGTNINYGGSAKPIVTTSLQGSGYSCQLTFVTLGNFNPYSIQGIVFEFSIAGRR
jgi:hypothetical protein|tara:strand:+ start:941 stop:2797 length:1857 start_codon:yes stop_codon:yes gene_type:complete